MKNLSTFLRILVFCGFSLALSSHETWAEDDPSTLFQQGNEAYRQGNFDQAIQVYEKITSLHGFSASVLYNLANSYVERGQIGKAILSYERAQRLRPGDPDIEGNLQHIIKAYGLFQPEPSFAERFISLLGMNGWTGLAAFSLILLCLSLMAIFFMQKPKTRPFIWITVGCMALLVVSCGAVVANYRSWHAAIVIEPKARIYISPFLSAASIGTIQEGRRVQVGKTHADFSYVTDETGRSGWIPNSAIETIIPLINPK